MRLERRLRVGGRAGAPQLVDKPVARDRLAAIEQEECEDGPLSRSAEDEGLLAVEHLERAEKAEVERARQEANVPGRSAS